MKINPFGVHFIPIHKGEHHWDYIRAVKPGILKIVGSSFPDVQVVSDGYTKAPDAIIYLRNHAISEQHGDMWNDPFATGKRHAQELAGDAAKIYREAAERKLKMPPKEKVKLLGINEPIIELFPRNEDMSNYEKWLAMINKRAALLDVYMVTLGTELNKLGWGAGLGNFSSGQPANLKPGEYPTFAWFPKTKAFLEQTRGINALAVHEYWRAEKGPQGYWDWHTCRFFHLKGNFDIDVLECGVDQYITSEDANGNRGWQGHMTAAEYAGQMKTYIERCMTDKRFRGATPFTLDGDKMWESFYIEPATNEMTALSAQLYSKAMKETYIPVIMAPATDIKLFKPFVGSFPITQKFGENIISYAPLKGHPGIDYALPMQTPVIAADNGTVAEVFELDSYGKYIKIIHSWGESVYGHLDKQLVVVGQAVAGGSLIGYSGNTGRSTGPHLHFAIRINPYDRTDSYDGYTDPAKYISKEQNNVPLEKIYSLTLQQNSTLEITTSAVFTIIVNGKYTIRISP